MLNSFLSFTFNIFSRYLLDPIIFLIIFKHFCVFQAIVGSFTFNGSVNNSNIFSWYFMIVLKPLKLFTGMQALIQFQVMTQQIIHPIWHSQRYSLNKTRHLYMTSASRYHNNSNNGSNKHIIFPCHPHSVCLLNESCDVRKVYSVVSKLDRISILYIFNAYDRDKITRLSNDLLVWNGPSLMMRSVIKEN